jgi:hypothetical protein
MATVHHRGVSAIPRSALHRSGRASGWLLGAVLVIALAAAAWPTRPEATSPVARDAETSRFELELRILQAQIERLGSP